MERTLSPIPLGEAVAIAVARLKEHSEKGGCADTKRDTDETDEKQFAHEASPC